MKIFSWILVAASGASVNVSNARNNFSRIQVKNYVYSSLMSTVQNRNTSVANVSILFWEL
jgi:hypothetical protein